MFWINFLLTLVPQILSASGDVKDDAHVDGGKVRLITSENFILVSYWCETRYVWTKGFLHFLHQVGNCIVIVRRVDDVLPESWHHGNREMNARI